MRILQIGPYPPPQGGVQTNLVAIRDCIRRSGGRAGVINLTRHRAPGQDEVYYPSGPLRTLWLMFRLPYDVLHLHIGGAVRLRLLALSLACCWMPGKKAVLSFHSGGYASSPEGRKVTPGTLRGFVFRRFAHIIAVNPEIAELFRRFGVHPDRIHLIEPHAAPEEAAIGPLTPDLEAFFGHHDPVLLSVGLLEPEYDLPLQIELIGRLRERHPRAGLALIGSGSLETELRSQIASKSYARHLLLCGDVPHPSTLRAIRDCTLLLRTTLYDGDAISVREALHFGTPVIAADNGMRPKGVYLVKIGHIDSVEAACERLLSGGGGRQAAVPSSKENLEAVMQLYRQMLGQS